MLEPGALSSLLADIALSNSEVKQRIELALSPEYWTSLAGLSIGSGSPGGTAPNAATVDLAGEKMRIERDGYFVFPGLLQPDSTARIAAAFDALRQAGWPVAFAFVFDELWEIYRHPVLVEFLSLVLGASYRTMPRIWAHFVAAQNGASGWQPHFDGKHLSKRITVWVPLSAATLENGCIYLVPQGRLSKELRRKLLSEPLSTSELQQVLQSVRALPAEPGQMMGWSFDVLHWGSVSQGAAFPRKSMAVEFIGEGEEPTQAEQPLLDLRCCLPTFEERLRAIGSAIVSYDGFDLMAKRFVPLGQELGLRL